MQTNLFGYEPAPAKEYPTTTAKPAMMYEYELTCKKTKFESVKVTSSRDIAECLRQFWGSDIFMYESMFLLLLNRANMTVGFKKIGQGGLTGVVCDPRLVAKFAVENLACNVVIAHNHPSGGTKPSQADEQVTEKISKGLALLDIKLLDHLIMTDTDYFSFCDEGLL